MPDGDKLNGIDDFPCGIHLRQGFAVARVPVLLRNIATCAHQESGNRRSHEVILCLREVKAGRLVLEDKTSGKRLHNIGEHFFKTFASCIEPGFHQAFHERIGDILHPGGCVDLLHQHAVVPREAVQKQLCRNFGGAHSRGIDGGLSIAVALSFGRIVGVTVYLCAEQGKRDGFCECADTGYSRNAQLYSLLEQLLRGGVDHHVKRLPSRHVIEEDGVRTAHAVVVVQQLVTNLLRADRQSAAALHRFGDVIHIVLHNRVGLSRSLLTVGGQEVVIQYLLLVRTVGHQFLIPLSGRAAVLPGIDRRPLYALVIQIDAEIRNDVALHVVYADAGEQLRLVVVLDRRVLDRLLPPGERGSDSRGKARENFTEASIDGVVRTEHILRALDTLVVPGHIAKEVDEYVLCGVFALGSIDVPEQALLLVRQSIIVIPITGEKVNTTRGLALRVDEPIVHLVHRLSPLALRGQLLLDCFHALRGHNLVVGGRSYTGSHNHAVDVVVVLLRGHAVLLQLELSRPVHEIVLNPLQGLRVKLKEPVVLPDLRARLCFDLGVQLCDQVFIIRLPLIRSEVDVVHQEPIILGPVIVGFGSPFLGFRLGDLLLCLEDTVVCFLLDRVQIRFVLVPGIVRGRYERLLGLIDIRLYAWLRVARLCYRFEVVQERLFLLGLNRPAIVLRKRSRNERAYTLCRRSTTEERRNVSGGLGG